MALHKYKCRKCGEVFTLFDDEERMCPKCSSKSIEKQIPSVNIRFNGKGFYKTDYITKNED